MTAEFKPLAGIRVVEMSHMVTGPSCGMFLAFLGAEVVKVEPPGGDKTRQLTGMGSAFFPLFNRRKKSVVLDYRTPAGKEALSQPVIVASAPGETAHRCRVGNVNPGSSLSETAPFKSCP
ncbi:MAG: CoA transferase [Paracoccus aminovorans]|nr:CoA transferase [Paracoccus aminovorans]